MKRGFVGAVFVPLLLVGTGCGQGSDDVAPVASSSASTAATAPAPESSAPGDTSTAGSGTVADDLANGRAQHVIRSSGVTATVYYETRKPGVPWTANGDKPLRVEVKVSRPRRKVYLNRVTLRFSVDDGTGSNPGPDPLVDTSSNIVPGFLVAPPYSYVQSFAVPAVDPTTERITIDLKLELVSLVDAKSRDYTKQTVTDRITTAVGP